MPARRSVSRPWSVPVTVSEQHVARPAATPAITSSLVSPFKSARARGPGFDPAEYVVGLAKVPLPVATFTLTFPVSGSAMTKSGFLSHKFRSAAAMAAGPWPIVWQQGTHDRSIAGGEQNHHYLRRVCIGDQQHGVPVL